MTNLVLRIRIITILVVIWLSRGTLLFADQSPADQFASTTSAIVMEWRTFCVSQLKNAQSIIINHNSEFAKAQIGVKVAMFNHHRGKEYPHYSINLSLASSDFVVFAFQVEDLIEFNDVPSVWYPTLRTSVPVSDRRYYSSKNARQLLPLDDPRNSPLAAYSYMRRDHNVVAGIRSTLQPPQLRRIIPIFEQALDACLAAGRSLPPAPCPRIASLPPHPVPPPPVLRTPPPLTITVSGRSPIGQMRLELGDWEHELAEPSQGTHHNTYTIVPIGWHSNFRRTHEISVALSGKTPISLKQEFNITGTEKDIQIRIESNENGYISIVVMRYYPSLPGVLLKSDWIPSAYEVPHYIIINDSGKAIRGSDGTYLWGHIERWSGGQWIPYVEISRFCAATGPGMILQSGDWDFSEVQGAKSEHTFPPGRYRYVIDYSTTLRTSSDRFQDVYQISSEFEIRNPD